MFYSHQLLARKAPLGQIWMAATMHAKINRRKLDKLNIIKICEEILNPSVPMALRLSGILMGGVVIVYERKVKLLYDDVTRFLVEINEAWKVKTVPDPTLLPKAKSKAKKEAVTLPGIREMNVADIEQSLQFSNTGTTTGFQHNAYFTMRLDNVDETFISSGAREEQDPSEFLHQADVENITLFERFETFQANADPYNRFERFDIEGDEETQVNVASGDQIPTTLIPSPPHQDEPTRADMFEELHPEQQDIQQPNEAMTPRQEPRRRGPNKRKRGNRLDIEMDYEQTIIPVHIYQHWLQNASDIVSRRGRKKQQTNVLSSTKIANLMKLPPVALSGDLFTAENNDIYYPAPILDLWIKSIQPPHDSPSERISAHHPPEPSFSSPPGVHSGDFMQFPSEDFDSRPDYQAPPVEKQRKNVLMDELTASLLGGHESTPHVSSVKAGDSAHSFPRPASEHGPASHSDFDSGRYSSSAKSSGGLEPLVEDVNFKLARLYEDGPTPDQELLVETGPTQTQVNINHPSDKITDSIQAHMKAHFDTPGAPPVESLHNLAAGMTRTSAAQLFYQICVLASRDALKVEQKVPYGEILFSRGLKM
ncbi:sister chromatid cohesion 1 protein 1 isoform X2 [Vigna radiata var. radiata]|uniref:Sister chromatid cohesion 1 protein 1 isoform X2 n=1 Tax=Vigna radiata var. radiata TaxID=3916 RepID=A0A3Q0F4Z7_VIGRR|nr:sister chromatid cohesion 1 protein 1 isoform X2 [Vigna radiata var. radiata]